MRPTDLSRGGAVVIAMAPGDLRCVENPEDFMEFDPPVVIETSRISGSFTTL